MVRYLKGICKKKQSLTHVNLKKKLSLAERYFTAKIRYSDTSFGVCKQKKFFNSLNYLLKTKIQPFCHNTVPAFFNLSRCCHGPKTNLRFSVF